jgi:hypothetical protein
MLQRYFSSDLTFVTLLTIVTLLNVLRENRSSFTPGAEAALDQGAAAVESGFLFNQGAHFRFALAHGLRKRAMPESLGMLESGHGHDDDCGRSLHASMRLLRCDNREALCLGR